MNAFIRSMTLNLKGLLRFTGVESRMEFWPYAGVVVGLTTVLGMASILPLINDSFARMQAFALAHPDQATITRGPGSYSIQIEGYHPELMPDLDLFMGMIAASVGLSVILLAAAVARRLRERGVSPWLGVLPVIFLSVAAVVFPKLFASFDQPGGPDASIFGLFIVGFFNNMLYLGSLLMLIIFLAGEKPYASPPAEPSAG